MAEYIEREALPQKKERGFFLDDDFNAGWNACLNNIKDIPSADVRPVVRGHWIGTKEAEEMGDIMKEFTCSVCGCCEWDCTESESFNFCPNCGADMRPEPPKEES